MVAAVQIEAKYVDQHKIAAMHGITVKRLTRLRAERRGPPYRKLGARTFLYNLDEFAQWLSRQPGGGEQIELSPPAPPKRTTSNRRKAA